MLVFLLFSVASMVFGGRSALYPLGSNPHAGMELPDDGLECRVDNAHRLVSTLQGILIGVAIRISP